jgi:hypothetical protein
LEGCLKNLLILIAMVMVFLTDWTNVRNTPTGVKVDASGCPLDRDGDGIPDYKDKCPDVKGIPENEGCPAVTDAAKKALEQAIKGITFETAKDIIQPSSYSTLDNC